MKPKRVLGLSLMTLALLTWFFFLRPESLGGPASYVIVNGHSMEPTLYTGDFVFAHRQSSYEKGDIVAYRAEQDGVSKTVIHRIVGGDGASGYQLKGDNKALPDPWTPRQSEVLGRSWLQIPDAGTYIASLHEPVYLAILLTVVVGLSIFGERQLRARRRTTRGNIMVNRTDKNSETAMAVPVWAVAGMAVGALLTAGLAFLTYQAISRPETTVKSVEQAKIKHTAAFDYAFSGTPSTLYPTGVVGPILPPATAGDEVAPVPFYVNQKGTFRLGFDYALESSQPATVEGEFSATLQIKASGDDGWTKTLPLVAPSPFSGSEKRAEIDVDFEPVRSLIDQIEEETGFQPNSYELIVQPVVTLKGTVAQQPIDERFAPPFTIKYYRGISLTPDADLRRSEPRTLSTMATQQQKAAFGLPVGPARFIGAGATLIALLLTAGVGSVAFLGVGLDDAAKLQARYGSRVISVHDGYFIGPNRVPVARLEDLAVLAERDGRIIFRQERDGRYLYFVPDGLLTYEFSQAAA